MVQALTAMNPNNRTFVRAYRGRKRNMRVAVSPGNVAGQEWSATC